ncbi:MarR family winged helix-turn-helix transcriptional regulator [Microbacterium sp. NPDC055988]|uniref:MarR family winged helix-turn-helix transcriptional regulator n=1 Tax=Microbacterium sp. NPDC055988 TaxID=3345671 RepID=UPI0035E368CF
MNTSESENPENTTRPFGYWLKAADRLMAAEFAAAFDGEHATRRDWRILNIVDGTVTADRPLNAHKLHRLVEHGWVTPEGDGWTLTDEGRAAKDRLGALVDGIRAKVSSAVSDEEMATTLASLEKIARAFGWDEETPLPRGRRHGFGGPRHGRGFPRGFGRPFGRGFGHGPEHGFGPDADTDGEHGCRHGGPGSDHRGHGAHGHGHPGHRGHGPHRAERIAQHAFERGFDAGFTRGRDA